LGSRLLPNFEIGTLLGEELHVFEVSGGEPPHLWECGTEIGREVIDDSGSPRLLALAVQYFVPNVVVKPDLLIIRRQQCSVTSAHDALLETG
jgi:hypothetical protein